MAITGLVDSAFLNNAHVQAFTVAGVDLTGRIVRWAMSLIDPKTGLFDPTEPALVKASDVPDEMTLLDGPGGEIDVNFLPEDTAPETRIGAGDYVFQLEVFDSGGDNGVVVSEGVVSWFSNIEES